MTIVMGLDQHRAQISAEWIETTTGELSRVRIAAADRDAVRTFLTGSPTRVSRSRWKRRPAGGSWSRSSSGSALRCTWPARAMTTSAATGSSVVTNVSASGDPAHVVRPHVHIVSSLVKRWVLGTRQGAISPASPVFRVTKR